jgi:Trypsin-co-occurring domain 1
MSMIASAKGVDVSVSETSGPAGPYDVAIALAAIEPIADEPGTSRSEIPGFERAWGGHGNRFASAPGSLVIEKGEAAVRQATEAIARQIGSTARRIAENVGLEDASAEPSDKFKLDSVEVSFGVTLTAGLQTIFTAQTESNVQVTITLTRASG